MPLTEKGNEILANLKKEYGAKKAEQVLYAGKNKGTFTGIDAAVKKMTELAEDGRRLRQRVDSYTKGK